MKGEAAGRKSRLERTLLMRERDFRKEESKKERGQWRNTSSNAIVCIVDNLPLPFTMKS